MQLAAAGAKTQGFVHPGVMYTQAQLNYTKAQLTANAQPHTQAYANMLATKAQYSNSAGTNLSSLSYTPHPHATIKRASGPEDPDDYDAVDDLAAALCHALIWNYKGTRANAQKSIEIMNAWAHTITEIIFDPSTSPGGKLLAGWTGTLFARAAELIRYTYTPTGNETPLDLAAVQDVLANVWWPKVSVGHSGPGFNWYMSFADSMMQIAVFLDDQTKFDRALAYIRQVLPGCIYMVGDNNPYSWAHPAGGTLTYSDNSVLSCPNGLPLVTKSVFSPDTNVYDRTTTNAATYMDTNGAWFHPLSLPNGLWGETGRDFTHTGMGFGALGNVFETAWHQGVDLYSEFQTRVTTSIELTTGFIYTTFVNGDTSPTNWPFSKSSDASSYATSTQRATFEILHHHYVTRRGLSLPNLTQYMSNYARANGYDRDLMINYETLTTYGTS